MVIVYKKVTVGDRVAEARRLFTQVGYREDSNTSTSKKEAIQATKGNILQKEAVQAEGRRGCEGE